MGRLSTGVGGHRGAEGVGAGTAGDGGVAGSEDTWLGT